MVKPGLDHIAGYRLMHLLRTGQLCELWEVEQPVELKRYAMKLLPPGELHTRANVASIKHEFTVGLPFKHPNVIETYEFGTVREGTYLLIEIFRVPNLKQQIVLGVDQIAHLAEEIIRGTAAGLAYIHEKGWVHRDVKPDNFLVGDDGTSKLIDFNLARKPAGGLGKMLGLKTAVQGTMSYMSPEQIRGQQVGVQADIYSFGCMMYELLSGKPPFTGVSSSDLLNKHLKTRPASLTASVPNVRPEFARLVERMVAKDPKARPDTMKEVLDFVKPDSIFRRRPAPPSDAPPKGEPG